MKNSIWNDMLDVLKILSIKFIRPLFYMAELHLVSLAPRIAAHFRTGLTADCTMLGIKENTDLIQVRPAFGGNVMAQIICPNNRPQMATVRYKIFKNLIKLCLLVKKFIWTLIN